MATKKLILLLCLVASVGATKVKLSDIKAITLTAGQYTTGRRSSPVLQLQCRGHLCNHAPDTVQCINRGSDGLDAQWNCEGDLPKWCSFANADVNCEGYDYPNDPYILAGSCGMSYRLTGTPPRTHHDSGSATSTGFGTLLLLVGLLLLCCHNTRGNRPYPTAYPYYGGGNTGTTTATAAAVGAAAGYAAGRSSSSGWGWGRGYRSRSGRGTSSSSSSSGGRRTAHTFSGTSRR
jgi:hypothetical protein